MYNIDLLNFLYDEISKKAQLNVVNPKLFSLSGKY